MEDIPNLPLYSRIYPQKDEPEEISLTAQQDKPKEISLTAQKDYLNKFVANGDYSILNEYATALLKEYILSDEPTSELINELYNILKEYESHNLSI